MYTISTSGVKATGLLARVQEAVHNRAAIELQLAELSKLAGSLSVLLDINDPAFYPGREV